MSICSVVRSPSLSLLDKEFSAQIRLACVFGNLGNEALVVTRDDEVNNMILHSKLDGIGPPPPTSSTIL